MSSGADKTQITDHRAFRPAVALWFAALLGLGFFLMPQSIHTTLADLVGFGGRAMFAAIAAIIGLVAGYLLAGRIAANNTASVDTVTDGEAGNRGSATAPSPFSEPALERAADAVAPQADEGPSRRRVFNPREDIGDPGIPAADAAAPVAASPFAIPAFESGSQDEDIDGLVAVDDFDVDGDFGTRFASSDGGDPLMHVWRNDADFEADTPRMPAFNALTGDADKPARNIGGEVGAAPFTPPTFTAPFPATESVERFATTSPLIETEAVETETVETVALGDLSLDELAGRLAAALAARKQAEQEHATSEDGETLGNAGTSKAGDAPTDTEARPIDDPVVAFLRRETHRGVAAAAARPPEADPQAILRDALDRLTRANKP